MSRTVVCPLCRQRETRPFFERRQAPVHQHLLLSSRADAQSCLTGDVVLNFCPGCGFIFNAVFDPELLNYSNQYDNSAFCSPVFRTYVENLAADLVKRHQLHHKQILEIGCGQGEFLHLLCEIGHNTGIGFDPAYLGDQLSAGSRVNFVKDFYSTQYATQYKADFICARHVLEHMPVPLEFLDLLRSAAGPREAVIFIELPDVAWILRNLAFWDIFYEHCSYYCSTSLRRLFSAVGCQVTSITPAFGEQYLWLEARAYQPDTQDVPADGRCLSALAELVHNFEGRYRKKMDQTRRQLFDRRRRQVVWGAGGKGVTLLNSLQVPLDVVEYVVDVNPRKQGKYIPGTGQQIVAPQFLKQYQPEQVFVMNANYLSEIEAMAAEIGFSPDFVSL